MRAKDDSPCFLENPVMDCNIDGSIEVFRGIRTVFKSTKLLKYHLNVTQIQVSS